MRSIEARCLTLVALLRPLAVTQKMKRVNVFLGQSYPLASTDARPQVTRQASAQPLAVVVNLGQQLMTLIATLGFVFGH